MKVLVINAGSSSLKYQLLDTESENVLAKGNCERIGIDGSRLIHKCNGKSEYIKEVPMPDHSAAMKLLVDALVDTEVGCLGSIDEIEAVGHRVVHGGQYFADSVLLSDEVLADKTAYMQFTMADGEILYENGEWKGKFIPIRITVIQMK